MAESTQTVPLSNQTTIDGATILGLFVGFALIAVSIVMGGSPGSFLNVPSVLIVIGGTFAITTASFSLQEMGRTIRVASKTFTRNNRDPSSVAFQTLQIAEMARKQGVLALQNVIGGVRSEPLLLIGLDMVIDGTPGEEVEAILRRDMQATYQRHQKSINVLRRMAELSPAMGLIGTLIGLVQMLGNLDDPSKIGPSMAVALLTTFYGAVLSNMVFTPLANKLERNSTDEALINQIYVLSTGSIGRQENPRRLEMMLNSILPPERRINYFD
ncbi:MAG: MotA/TolQ/ExbB proton channel family protein [Rhodospirillaceae bacterium]